MIAWPRPGPANPQVPDRVRQAVWKPTWPPTQKQPTALRSSIFRLSQRRVCGRCGVGAPKLTGDPVGRGIDASAATTAPTRQAVEALQRSARDRPGSTPRRFAVLGAPDGLLRRSATRTPSGVATVVHGQLAAPAFQRWMACAQWPLRWCSPITAEFPAWGEDSSVSMCFSYSAVS